jgi:hypothetical protein
MGVPEGRGRGFQRAHGNSPAQNFRGSAAGSGLAPLAGASPRLVGDSRRSDLPSRCLDQTPPRPDQGAPCLDQPSPWLGGTSPRVVGTSRRRDRASRRRAETAQSLDPTPRRRVGPSRCPEPESRRGPTARPSLGGLSSTSAPFLVLPKRKDMWAEVKLRPPDRGDLPGRAAFHRRPNIRWPEVLHAHPAYPSGHRRASLLECAGAPALCIRPRQSRPSDDRAGTAARPESGGAPAHSKTLARRPGPGPQLPTVRNPRRPGTEEVGAEV